MSDAVDSDRIEARKMLEKIQKAMSKALINILFEPPDRVVCSALNNTEETVAKGEIHSTIFPMQHRCEHAGVPSEGEEIWDLHCGDGRVIKYLACGTCSKILREGNEQQI